MAQRWEVLVATLHRLGVVPLVLRGAVLAAGIVAIVATTVPSWDVPDGYVYIAVLAMVIAVVVPDSGGWFFVAAAIVAGWATGSATPVIGPAVVVTALALLAGHIASALAAAMPVTAAADLHLALRWWRPTAVLATATVGAAVVVTALDAWGPPGSIVIILAALGVVGTAVWSWSSEPDDEPR
jgi:hypothetical protein